MDGARNCAKMGTPAARWASGRRPIQHGLGGLLMPLRSEPWPAGTPCWVDLGSPDVAASSAFYGGVLGWSFVDTGEEFGHYTIGQVNGHAAAAIGPKQDPGPANRLDRLPGQRRRRRHRGGHPRQRRDGAGRAVRHSRQRPDDGRDGSGRRCVRRVAGQRHDRRRDLQRAGRAHLDRRPADRPGHRAGLLRRRLRLPLPAMPGAPGTT